MSTEKNWVDILSALLTPTIAIFGTIFGTWIAWQQGRVNRLRLKHELFDRRYTQFEATRNFLGTIMTRGQVLQEEEFKWLQATRGSRFLFDESISAYFEELFKKSVHLQTLQRVLEGLPVGEERSKNVEQQREIKDWFMAEWNGSGLETRFAPYLQLKH